MGTGVWVDKDGNDQDYFVGSNEGTHVCSCGLLGNCSGTNQGYTCNCDNMVPTIQHDHGVITDSSALPILGFKYGLMLYPAQIATINIGRFKCMGQKTIRPDEVADSCATLKTYGISESGNYILNNENVVFCNMDKLIDESGFQTQVGKLKYDDGKYDVRFIAYRNDDDSYIGSGKITFDGEAIDTSSRFSYSSGTFTAPHSGRYLFSLSGTCYAETCYISTYVNDEKQDDYQFYDYHYAQHSRQFSTEFTIYLSYGDEIYLYDNYSNGFEVGSGYGL